MDSPPSAGTLESGASGTIVKRITPCRLHDPPVPTGAAASARPPPPSTSMRKSVPLAKNPRERLLGDQNGKEAPSVPARGRALPVTSERSHSMARPSEAATKASVWPSGESASDTMSVVGGVVISTLSAGTAFSPLSLSDQSHTPPATRHTRSAAAHPRRSRELVRDDVAVRAAGGSLAASSIASRASRMSASLCFRSFSRHRRSRRRTLGGVSTGRRDQFGWSLMTAAITSVVSVPPKARSPVSISNSTQPHAQISAPRSTTRPRACSGLM